MTHPVDELQEAARAAIAHMKDSAIAARNLHARAELMRHMQATAAKLAGLPLEQAARKVAGEWMQAWGLNADGYWRLAADIDRFALAFCADASGAAATQAAIREALAALEAGFAAMGTSLADEMAFRSECAHGWWRLVVPARAQDAASGPNGAGPFWSLGAPPHCGAPAY